MRMSFKTLLIIWAFLFAGFATLAYLTYSRLQPETFVELLDAQVQKNYPGSKLEIGTIDYRPGLDLSLTFRNVRITRSEKVLGSIGELEVRLPWWLLISDRGSAQINVNRLEVFLNRGKESVVPLSSAKATGTSPAKIRFTVPEYLTGVKYTLRAKDIVVRDAEDSRRHFALSKLLVKEFQYGKNSAFELNLPIEITHNRAKFTSELWLFGDITPDAELWRLNYRGEFRTRDLTDKSDLEDLAIDGKAEFRPSDLDLRSKLVFRVEREKVGEGGITADNSGIALDFHFTAFPLEYLGIFSEELKNPYLPQLSGSSEGSVQFVRRLESRDPAKLEARFSFDGTFPLGPDHIYAGKWQFQFSGTKWETSFITPRSEVSFFRRSIIDLPRGEVVQFIEEIGFSGIPLDPALGSLMSLPVYRTLTFPHYYSTKVSFTDCLRNEEKVSGTLLHGYAPDARFYQVDLKGKGNLKLNYQLRESVENFSFESKDFLLSEGSRFFSPLFSADSGIITGKAEGKWTNHPSQGNWNVNLKVSQLFGATGELPGLISSLTGEFQLSPKDGDSVTLNGSLKDGMLQLSGFILEGDDTAKITGTLSEGKASHLTLQYPKNKKWKPVKKEITGFKW